MARDRRREKRGKKGEKKRSDFKDFLKKRAPIYLGLVALFVVFVVPEFTKSDLPGSLPELEGRSAEIAHAVLQYSGPDGEGLSIIDAVSDKIADEHPDENIYDDDGTVVDLRVRYVTEEIYQVVLEIKSHKSDFRYDWNIDTISGNITATNQDAKHALALVEFYD